MTIVVFANYVKHLYIFHCIILLIFQIAIIAYQTHVPQLAKCVNLCIWPLGSFHYHH